MLELQSVSFGYGDDAGKAPEIRGIDMSVKKSECVLLCGASGCGKSTILETINGIIPNLISGRLGGNVLINGKSTGNVPMYELAAKVSSVFQNPKTQFFNTDAESEITYGLENRGMSVDVINEHIVQKDLGFEAYPGEIIGIVGSNGAGKTTLLRTLAGHCKPKRGEITYNVKSLSARQRRRLFGLVMQDVNYQLFSDSVRNEVLLENSSMSEQMLSSVLDDTGLSGLEDRHPQSLSGGQKQRLAIAAAYASGRRILLFDEPTSGLDHRSMLLVGKLLKKLSEKGVISIVVTHDTEFIESVCGRIFMLEKNV